MADGEGTMKQMSFWQGFPRASSQPALHEGRVEEPTIAEGEKYTGQAEALAQLLAGFASRAVRVVVTDNRRTMLSWRVGPDMIRVRLHHMFLAAPASVWDALALYLFNNDGRAGAVIDGYIEDHHHQVRPVARQVQPKGRFHDLRALFVALNDLYFHGGCQAEVTWSRAGSRRYRRSIQLGSYVPEDRMIRIHPCLDQSFVPAFYVSWVLFHEMLHEIFGVEKRNTRRSMHPPAFRAIEESYPDHRRAKVWEEKNINRLLRYRYRHP